MPESGAPHGEDEEPPSRWEAWGRAWSPGWELYQRGSELELFHRSLAFAALGLVALVPLLIVVAAADPLKRHGFASWMADAMALSGRSADAVGDVFGPTGHVLPATSVFSLIALVAFGLTFSSSVQTGYAKIWGVSIGAFHRVWRQVTWSAVLVGYLYADTQTSSVVGSAIRIPVNLCGGVLFFWWGQRYLLRGLVPWRLLLPGAVATMIGLVGLRAFSYLVFAPLIVSNAISYGTAGTVLVVESWLVGVGFVIFGSALLGRYPLIGWVRTWANGTGKDLPGPPEDGAPPGGTAPGEDDTW
ncbi:YihY/virulence factor BrkB family protein [Actinacidiphila acidipaludis]|uniref:YihY/virulence factor BrkB family protein n=1 Tax=Actinacidiphila acidipaludis TaxID=2873382 RepID=UPI00223B1E08|nr:YihY/virulence factor BrkB family protein [Streptomyces acidipaludis]